MPVAQKIEGKVRTEDVLITENVDFGSLLLSGKVLDGLRTAGFERPSPIQLKAVPLGRCGLDLIVQAKSGTGKTCVFTIVALESIALETFATQVLVLVPTREIALQVWHVITSIGVFLDGLQCHTFIGGMPLPEDKRNLKKCHIAVGTPGRIKQLIEMELLKIESIRLFILDEADKLLEESFQEQINWIYSVLPENKQMLALSATYPEYLAQHLTAYMRNPTFVRLNASDPTLLGIKQYYMKIPFHPVEYKLFENKIAALLNVLSSVTFHQCLIFSNLQTRAQHLSDILNKKSWPTSCIAGSLDQRERINVMAKLKAFKCRILISTDLTSRGVDAEFVNLVVNLDLPRDHETYLHRIGRSGRFGSSGVAITLVCEGDEEKKLKNLGMKCNTLIDPIPDPLTADLISNQNIRTDCVIPDKSKAKSVTTFSDIKEFKGSHTHPDQCFPAQQVKDIAHFNLNDFDVSSNEISTPSVALSQDSILNLCDTGLKQMDPKKDDSDSCHDSIASLVSHMSDLQMTQGRDDDISQKTVLCNLHVTDTANQNSYLTKAQKKDGSAGVRIIFKKQQSEIETLTVPFWKKSSHFAKVCVPSLKLVLEEFETFLEREEQLENHNVDLRTVFPGKLNLYNESNTRDITNLLNQKYEHYRFHHKFASPEVPAKSDLTCEKSFLHGTFPNCSENYSWHYNYAKEDGKQMDLLEHDKFSSPKTGRSHNNSESVANLAETADNHASEFFLETGNKKTFKRHFKCWQNKDNISTSKKPERTVSSNNGDYSSFDGYLETEDSDDSDFDSKDSQTSGFFNLSQRNKSVQTSGAYYYDYYSCLWWLWACQPWYRSYLSWYQNQDPTNRMNVERGRHFMEQQMNYISMMLRGNHLLSLWEDNVKCRVDV